MTYQQGLKQHISGKTPKWLENLQGANVTPDDTNVDDGTSAADGSVSADALSKIDGEQANSSNRGINDRINTLYS